MTMCLTILFQLVAILSAGVAALYWWKSARVPVPKELGFALWGDSDDSFAASPEKTWATMTSKANAKGAIAAAVSFAAQFGGMAIDLLGNV